MINYKLKPLSFILLLLSHIGFAHAPSKPFGSNTSYSNGVIQNIQTPAQASSVTQSWYTYWKTNFTKSCGGGKTLAVNDYNGSNAYSEGQGYGLLLAAYMGDKTLFDELWKGFKDNRNSSGVMNWTVSCSGTVAANGATDGDLDAAMGLLIANKQWPGTTSPHNYSSDATALITAIKDTEFMNCSGVTVQKPGDKFGGCDCTNPSYYAVGYYRAFGKHVTSQASFWEKAASDGLTLLLKATNSSTGLNPAWTDQSGSITSGGNCNVAASGGGSKTDYQFDAARTPWRIVVDYLWWGTPASKQYLDKIGAWANTKGISNIVAGFRTDGSNIANYKNSAFTGAFAIGAMATNQTQANSFYNWWVSNSTTEGNVGSRLDDRPYFQNTLRVMYSLVSSGNFWNPYTSGGTTTPPASVVSVSLTHPANNSSVVQGSPVVIEASASSTQGATITGLEFTIDGIVSNTDNSSPYTYSTSGLSAGNHIISVKATDSNGNTATTSNISITVTPPVVNSVVSVNLTSPASGASFVQGNPVNVSANASSTNGASITNVEFSVDGVIVNTDNSSPYTYSTSGLSAGNHTISVKATDSNGKTASTSNIAITVTAPVVNSVVSVNLTSPANGASFVQVNPVNISAIASSTNGASITSVEFSVDAVIVITDNSSPYSFSTSTLSVGNHTVSAKATDSNGKTAATSNISFSITSSVVNSVVFVDLTSPSNGASFVLGSPVNITANVSSTNGASITKVEFLIDGAVINTDNSSPYSFSTSGLSVGNHTVSVRATDSNGKTAITTSVNFSITNVTVPPSSENVSVPQPSIIPVIDGNVDEVWNKVAANSISKEIIPSISGSGDLSATYKTLWDNTNLYILVNVTDDVKINDSGNEYYKDDAVELFFDIGNDKSTKYGSNDAQLTFRWNDNAIYAGPVGRSTTNIQFQMAGNANGYILEVKIPWSTIQATPSNNQILGFDVHINDDDDSGDRDGKLAWAANSDNAWQNPSLLGIAKLTATVSGLYDEFYGQEFKIYPNPFSNLIKINGLDFVDYEITDLTGKIIQSGIANGQIETNFESGVYYLVIKKPTGIKPVKMMKTE